MPRQTNKLTALAVKNAKYTPDSPNKMFDGGGLYLFMHSNNSKYWRMDYRRPVTKKRNTFSFGVWPDINLEQARKQRDEIRRLIAQGIDPAVQRQNTKHQQAIDHNNTFDRIAAEWLDMRSKEGKLDHENRRRLKCDILPYIGKIPLIEITHGMIQTRVIDRIIERHSLSTAQRVKGDIKAVFKFAESRGLVSKNPTEYVVVPRHQKSHHAALIEPADVKRLLQDVWSYCEKFPRSRLQTEIALKLSLLLFLRPNEIRHLQWSEYFPEERVLKITASKVAKSHIIPLSNQAIELIQQLEQLKHYSPYLLPHQSRPHECMSEGTVNMALKRLGYGNQQTAHGTRATARTMLAERMSSRVDIIEHQLAHVVKDPNGTAYNRTAFIDARHLMMQQWADYLDMLRTNQPTPIPQTDQKTINQQMTEVFL